MGVDKDGIIIAKEVKIVADYGAYEGLAGHVLQVSTVRSDNMHRYLKNVRLNGKLAYTNNPPHGALRGFGGPQAAFALNSHIAVMAEKLGLDVVEMLAVTPSRAAIPAFMVLRSAAAACRNASTRSARASAGTGRKSARRIPASSGAASASAPRSMSAAIGN